jgi:hypothetical protein
MTSGPAGGVGETATQSAPATSWAEDSSPSAPLLLDKQSSSSLPEPSSFSKEASAVKGFS